MRSARLVSVLAAAALALPASARAGGPPAAAEPVCTNSAALGVSRIVEIDTTTGPHFGEQFHKSIHFLEDREVVLTFDDGPMKRYTEPVLAALDEQCTKATFFSVGRMAIADPATLRDTARRGHTIGFHTWSHAKLATVSQAAAKREIELGASAVSAALGTPIAPFFRFPYLAHSTSTLNYVTSRGVATIGIDIDSADFRTRSPGVVLRNVMSRLKAKGRGIILFHDIQPSTAGALSSLLAELKAGGFKVVHMVAKAPMTTLPDYDASAAKMLKGKEIAAKSDPMAPRAATWPIQGGTESAAKPTVGPAGEALPWTPPAPAQKAPPRPERKTDWGNLESDPWRLNRTFGD